MGSMSQQASATNFIRNQSVAAIFLTIEVLAAIQIGYGSLLAWLLSVIAAWNAALLITGIVGVAMIAAKTINEETSN